MALGESLLEISAALAVAGSGVAASAPDGQPLFWQGVAQVNIQCQVATDRGMENGPVRQHLCRAIHDFTARHAPVPVRLAEIGDPAVLRPDALTLLAHASITATRCGSILAFYIRPYRNAERSADLMFGAMPRAVMLRGGDTDAAAVDAAVAATLRDTLPWGSTPGGTRELKP